MTNRKKICFVVAVPITANAFLPDHFEALGKEFDVYIAGQINSLDEIPRLTVTSYQNILIKRNISILSDLRAVFTLSSYFRKMKFDAVHSISPKAGLITALAARIAGIKHRTHIFTGQVWATRHGAARQLLKSIDKIIADLDNHVLVDGFSQRDFLVKEHVLKEDQALVFGSGSIAGVNVKKFVPSDDIRIKYRRDYGISDGMVVFVYLGRLNPEKGIAELFAAFNRIAGEHKDVGLLMIGSDEGGFDKLGVYENIKKGTNFFCPGYTHKPYEALQAGDVFCLPTYREGFGSSVIEASCLSLPVICSDVYGVMDAMVDNVTGLRCKVKDVESLYTCMLNLYERKDLREKLGRSGRKRVLEEFSSTMLSQAWLDFYQGLFLNDKYESKS